MNWISDAFLFIGASLLVLGAFWIYQPAGVITGGVVCIVISLAAHRAAKRTKA